jgi:GNAT superfamily N-acetyltransferase
MSEHAEFRRLFDDELAAAHEIVAAATAWLNERGVVQWSRVLPWEAYFERQQCGENFGLFEPELSAVMTLAHRVPDYWPDVDVAEPFLWLSTLAATRSARGAGARAVRAAIAYAADAGCTALYLDCVDREDALPSFYRRMGFALIERREVWPGWPMCLFAMNFR